MMRQITPDELPTIQIAVVLAYIIVLLATLGVIKLAVCDIKELQDQLGVLLALAALLVVSPWLFVRVVVIDIKQRAKREYRKVISQQSRSINQVVDSLDYLIQNINPSSQDKINDNNDEINTLIQELRVQVQSLSDSQDRSEARNKAASRLQNRINRMSIIADATKICLKSFDRLPELSSAEKRKLEKGVKEDIKECLNWLCISLKVGHEQDVNELKEGFIIQSQMKPYEDALKYIRDIKIPKYRPSDLEIEEVNIYIGFLIDGLRP